MPFDSPAVVGTLPEILKSFGIDFDGWYAESAEGVVTRYEEPEAPASDEDVEELAEEAA